MEAAKEIKRPIVRYHGGKFLLAPWIISHFPKHRVYVEAFGGGGSILLRKPRAYLEIYNDLDGDIVNLFKVARDDGEQLRQLLELTPFARDEYKMSCRKMEGGGGDSRGGASEANDCPCIHGVWKCVNDRSAIRIQDG